MLEATLDARVAQPDEATHEEQHLCADAAYVGQPAQQAISQRGLIAHVRSRKQEELQRNHGPQAKPRRWVVERSHSWLNRFRKLMVRYEKSAASFEALLSLAAALICWRQYPTRGEASSGKEENSPSGKTRRQREGKGSG